MALTYEEFKKVVPKETVEFVDLFLPYWSYYVNDNRKIELSKVFVNGIRAREFVLILHALNQMDEYRAFLGNCGYQDIYLSIDNSYFKSDKSKIFDKCNYLFDFYKDKINMQGLFPLDVLRHLLNDYCITESMYDSLFQSMIEKTLKEKVINYQTKKDIEVEHQLAEKLYENLSISAISYLETASRIRRVLNNKYSLNISEDDTASLSLFLSLYYYEDMIKIGNTKISEKEVLQSYLEEHGIKIEDVLSILGIEPDKFKKSLDSVSRNVYAIKYYYQKYYKDLNEKNIPVASILENLCNRELSNSVYVEKLLNKLGISISELLTLRDKMDKMIELEEQKSKKSYISNFYDGLTKETKDYIEFATKTYLLILQKMKKEKHNKEILACEDDADTFALYIATYYFNGLVAQFFEKYDVTLDKILELLQLKITKEEIEEITLPDKKIVVDRYHRFVYEGVNENKKEITIDDISFNLCNRKFNHSMIMENIFNELTDDISLTSDFEGQIKEYFKKQKRTKIQELENEIFLDMPVESIEYLERVSKIHQFLEKRNRFEKDVVKVLSLLLSVLLEEKEENIRKFYEKRGFKDAKSILEYLSYGYLDIEIEKLKDFIMKSNADLELLQNEYYDFIFKGCNTGLERNKLTIYQISKNMFNKELHHSVYISRLLGYFNQSYKDYENLDDLYRTYLNETLKKLKEEQGQKKVEQYEDIGMQVYTSYILKIHPQLREHLKENKNSKIVIETEEDIAVLSLIIGLFKVENDIAIFFQKHGLNYQSIVKAIDLEFDLLSWLEKNKWNKEVNDYTIIPDFYTKYLENTTSKSEISDVIKGIFDKKINQTTILEQLASYFGIDYNILKTEVLNKMDYESTLSISERIELLGKQNVGELDSDSMESILHFGESLSIHSKYIHDELPKLMLSDVHEESVTAINEMISKIYKKEPKEERNLFARIFKLTFLEEEPKLVLDPKAVEELKTAIDTNIQKLSNELLGYDSIRKYIEVYYKKNYAHYVVAQTETGKLETKMGELNPEDEASYIEFLEATSHLQIMRDKTNRFRTSSQLMKQELARVNSAIVTHFITINALEMARDDLFPLIGSELMLSKGHDTESSALELSQSVISLFQSMLERNADKAASNMEKLKNSNLPPSILELLNKDIELYLSGIEQVNMLEEQSDNPLLTQTTLTINEKPKQKVYEI